HAQRLGAFDGAEPSADPSGTPLAGGPAGLLGATADALAAALRVQFTRLSYSSPRAEHPGSGLPRGRGSHLLSVDPGHLRAR
ncbi:MAG: hypothetical protein M0T80_14760, partial [Actinomycetota bacterium]|nr:hypothetical protein [Actinomycetota bacterium]